VNLEDVTAELLTQPLEQFTSYRNARAKQLKASGQADLASQLSTLKRPSVSLWAANQVARSDAAVLRNLRQSAQALAKAQAAAGAGRANAAQELRRASEDFQQKLDAVSNAAAAALRQGQHPAGDETLRRVREIFRTAALKGGEPWDQLQEGGLASEPQPGEDVLEMFGSGSAPADTKSAERLEKQRATAAAEKAARADAERATETAATALRLRQEATAAASAAQRAADRATAAEEEATRAKAQAKKSQRAITGRGD
jgi:hypothetical protein